MRSICTCIFKKEKEKKKKDLRSISQPHAYLQSMVTMSAKFQTFESCAHKVPSIHSLKCPKKLLSSNCEKKMTKNNPRIISKPHAYLQTMPITHVKWHKTVGGVAHTMYPLPIHFHWQNARKMAKFKLQKSDKN